MKFDPQGVLATFRGKAADELTRLREENEALVAERDRLRMQLEAAQDAIPTDPTAHALSLLTAAYHGLGETADAMSDERLRLMATPILDQIAEICKRLEPREWTDFRERRPGFICEVLVYWQLLQMDRAILTVMQYRPDRDVWISRSGHEYGSDEYIGFLFWLPLPAPPTQEQVERAMR